MHAKAHQSPGSQNDLDRQVASRSLGRQVVVSVLPSPVQHFRAVAARHLTDARAMYESAQYDGLSDGASIRDSWRSGRRLTSARS